MNQIAWQIFGGLKSKANTFIGGVASTITTAGALATKLGIASNRITNFKIVGSDIECSISGEYAMTDSCWNGDSLLTYYKDNNGLVVNPSSRFIRANANLLFINFPRLNSLIDECFVNTNAIEEINLPLLTTMSGNYGAIALNSNLKRIILPQLVSSIYGYDSQFWYSPSLKTLYIPRCTSLGSTQGRNAGILTDSNLPNLKIYAHPSLQTSNGGGVEGDLAFAISNGATVRYVTNFTAPSSITDLTSGTITSTSIQLNFTAPTGSANAIDYYEIWLNGVNSNKTITASGQYITGLTLNTTYNIELKPVDIFYNKSTSNNIIRTTLT
ncbi:MAG: hypothetical protein RL308_3483 [Bacteroidota bacterium]|jgi:hypothetical protein